jgi:hypothetical protein
MEVVVVATTRARDSTRAMSYTAGAIERVK